MMESVVAYLMTFGNNLFIKFRIFADIVANHKECCLDAELAKGIEDKGRALRNGTVVERKVNRMFVLVHSP